ncbi:Hsp70 family protein [Crassaminicella profunda]|uniref:Hsp70 family protein n=1 Tax=Crassaminicella profunda TaxID=1286698 RepID=UPI001CA693C0|nr:Hsp70 family protein [Crassaminicella profunda]QZY56860.1 Hsp70 family protein [Crassaminicella profunda]
MSWLGIDLGTSFSSAAIIENGKPVALKVATSRGFRGDSFSIPSSVFINDNGEILLGQAADNNRLKAPDRFKDEFKRDLGQKIPYELRGYKCLPEGLYKEFFKYFKIKAEERIGKTINKVVVTYPAKYAKYKKDLIEEAAKKAGFGTIKLLDEPTAAAIYYSTKENIKYGEKILVYDLGGGTFDVALIQKEKGNTYKQLTESLGLGRCGGIDFDRKIFKDMKNTFINSLQTTLSKGDINSDRLVTNMFQESIKVKHQLSTDKEAFTSIKIEHDFEEYALKRENFEEMIQADIENTCKYIRDIVKNAGLEMKDIDKVLLVGGSTRIPYVKEMVEKTIGKKTNKDFDPELAICFGAAVLENNEEEDLHNNVEKSDMEMKKDNIQLVKDTEKYREHTFEDANRKDKKNDRYTTTIELEAILKMDMPVWSIAFHPKGRFMAMGKGKGLLFRKKGEVELWDAVRKESLGVVVKHENHVNSVAFSPNGRILVSGSRDKTIKLWGVESKVVTGIRGNKDKIGPVAFSPDGRILAFGSYDGTLKLWDVERNVESKNLVGHTERISSVVFSPDGSILASGSLDETIKLWDVKRGVVLKNLIGHNAWPFSVAFSPDGSILASGGFDNLIKLWDIARGVELKNLVGHNDKVRSVVFSPNGKILASGSYDGTLKLWDVERGVVLNKLTGHGVDEVIYAVAFSPDGKKLVTSGTSQTVSIWNIEYVI